MQPWFSPHGSLHPSQDADQEHTGIKIRASVQERAAEEHRAALEGLDCRTSKPRRTTWLEKMPQFQSWLNSDGRPLCYLDTDEDQMTATLADTRQRSTKQLQMVYVDCSLICTQNVGGDQLWIHILRSLILQSIHANSEAVDTLTAEITNNNQSLIRSLHHILDDQIDDNVDMLNSDLWFAVVEAVSRKACLPYYIVIDKLHTVAGQIRKDMLSELFRRIAKIPHAMILSCEDPIVSNGIKLGYSVVSAEEERRGKVAAMTIFG